MTTRGPAAEGADVDVETFQEEARSWFASAAIPEVPEEYELRSPVLRDWHRTLYRAGYVGIQWPVEVGGRGLTAAHQLAFAAELVRARAPQPVGSIGLEVVGPTILKYGTATQRKRFVPPLLAGDEVWCQGFSEPDAGSDLASLRTAGVVDGDTLVVTGQKVWTSWATNADWCALLVRTDPDAPRHRGISYVLVDMRSPGVTVRPITLINGDAEFNELFFDEVRVPLANVLGGLNAGWKMAMDTLGWERAGYAIRRRLENEVTFTGLLDAVRARPDRSERTNEVLGRLFVELRGFRALSSTTAHRLTTGDVPSPLDSVDKLLLARTEQHLTGTALDVQGAYRLARTSADGTDPLDAAKAYLYGRAGSVYGGSAQIQRTIIAERLLGLPRG
ncbi:acyl-CoA dehydrogenase family protein [Pseudonocardia halophobica]|uniref:Acyl-CoA dehydrogenase n=1 Tax=Pseudonocardia halophobica TaxID=29401 RepID=A0A9W6L019_9PSEU|nr:acyl-CoA dehydrogenase family protein [Pseudonocardia halophobica]GLL09754.1 acyl-CoA dehydrogenase [Pseudonocardia halophobica]